MKIVNVSAMGIRCPEPNDYYSERHTVLVKLELEDGTIGWGEGIAMWPEAVRSVIALIEGGFGQLVIGENPLENEKVWTKLKRHIWWYGEGGIASFAISALDMAVWDLKGKILNAPLYQLLGGKVREKLPACASIHVKHADHQDNADEISAYMQQGYQSVKVGFGKKGKARLGQSEKYDIEFVDTIRRTVGDDKDLIVDIGNQVRWNVSHAVKMTKAFQDYGVLWIEEPFHPGNIEAHRRLRDSTDMLIGTGEREWTVDDYHRLLDTGIVDIVGIDPARAEGITAFRKVIELVGARRKTFNAHAWSTAITSAASIHLSISSEHCMLMELKPLPNPMQHELVREPIEQKDGWVFAPEGPGLGVEIDEDAVEKYRFV